MDGALTRVPNSEAFAGGVSSPNAAGGRGGAALKLTVNPGDGALRLDGTIHVAGTDGDATGEGACGWHHRFIGSTGRL